MRHRLHKIWLAIALALTLTFAATGATAAVPSDVVSRPAAGGSIMLHYPERFEPAAEQIEQRARIQLPVLASRLGVDAFPVIDVWLISDLDEFFEWNEVPSRAPEWAIGLSLTNRHTVLVRHGLGPDRTVVDIEKTFDHELAHVAIDVARRGHHVPLWLNEGFASWSAGEWTLERSELVARSAASNQLIPLENLESQFPPHHATTSLAYAQSHHLVNALATEYGNDVFARILDHIRAGETFSVAFTLVTNDDLGMFERRWRADLTEGSSPLSALASGEIFFFGASILFVVAWAVRRRKSRRKFEHLDDGLEGWDYDPDEYSVPGYPSRGV